MNNDKPVTMNELLVALQTNNYLLRDMIKKDTEEIIEKLAISIQGNFDELAERFGKVEDRITGLERVQ